MLLLTCTLSEGTLILIVPDDVGKLHYVFLDSGIGSAVILSFCQDAHPWIRPPTHLSHQLCDVTVHLILITSAHVPRKSAVDRA